jgi:hypothetical protein
MPSYCERCAKDRHLRALIDERGRTIEKCEVCDSTNVNALDCDDRTLKYGNTAIQTKALINLYS